MLINAGYPHQWTWGIGKKKTLITLVSNAKTIAVMSNWRTIAVISNAKTSPWWWRGPSSVGRVFDVNNRWFPFSNLPEIENRWLRISSISESENRVPVFKQIRINEPPVLFIWNPPRKTGGYEGDLPVSLKFWPWLSTRIYN